MIEVGIEQLHVERVFHDVPVVAGDSSVKIQTLPATARVVLLGTEDRLNSLFKKLQVVIPVQGLSRGRYRLEGRVELPEDMRLVRVEPKSFIVEVQ